MNLKEAYESKNWDEVINILDTNKRDTTEYEDEYSGGREIRGDQVGNRSEKNTEDGPVTVNKLKAQFQKKIVRAASSFLFGNPVKLEELTDDTNTKNADSDEESEDFQILKKKWKELRLDSLLLTLATQVKSKTESAILFRAVADGVIAEEDKGIDVKIKASIIGTGDTDLMPGFDDFNDLIVFGYKVKATNEAGEEIDRFYIYDKTNVIILDSGSNGYVEVDNKPHFFNRIPIVYVSQFEPEWFDVKELIDRYEMALSKFADTNDYFASPFFKATGNIAEPPKKDDSGKIFMLDVISTDKGQILQSDLDVVSWDQSTDSTKLEFDELKGLINELTDTPDFSLDSSSGLGNVAAVALELMFLGPILKAKYSEGTYRTAIERIINVLKAGMVYATNEISEAYFETPIGVNFTSVLPQNLSELISTLSEATMNKPIMSQKTAVSLNPLVKNAAKEMDSIKTETEPLGESLIP